MKIETEPRDDQQVKVIVELESDATEGYKRRAARKISQDAKIPGFRPGKAPFDVVKRLYGEEAIEKQAVEIAMDEIYPKMLEEAKIEPAAPGAIEDVLSFNPIKIAFIVPLAPQVTLGDYHTIRVPYEPKEVSDEDVENQLRRIQTSYATAEPVERPSEMGDLIYLKLSAELTQPAEGEESKLFENTAMQLVVGEGDFSGADTYPYAGFSKDLIGLGEGDEKDFTITHAEDDDDEKLRGKEVHYTATIQGIKGLHKPELDDEFAKTVGEHETLDDLRVTIRKQMESASQNEVEEAFFDELINQIREISTIKYPPQILEQEVEHLIEHLKEDLSRRGMEFDTYMKVLETTPEKYIESELKPIAARRVERSLIMDEISRAEKIDFMEGDVENASRRAASELEMASRYNKGQKVTNEMINNATFSALNRIFTQRILDRLKAIATGTYTPAEEVPAVEETKTEEAESNPTPEA